MPQGHIETNQHLLFETKFKSPNVSVSGMWENVGVDGQNPQRHREKMKKQRREEPEL